MQEFDREPAFILARTPYKESQYLLDILTLSHGRLRGIARITKQKTHRETENLAPFRELHISGRRKTELLTLQHSDIAHHYPLHGRDFLTGIYLNELILRTTEAEHPDPELYRHYRQALMQPDATTIRQLEWHLVQELGLLPERTHSAHAYRLQRENDWYSLQPASTGYEHNLIIALENNQLPTHHPQLKHYLQTLLSIQQHRDMQSKNTTLALLKLLKR